MRREKDKEEEERKRKEDKEEVKEVKEIEEREKESKNIDSCKIRPALQPEGRMQSSSQPVIQPIGIVQSSGQVAGSAETNEKIYSVVRKARKTVGFSPITSNNIKEVMDDLEIENMEKGLEEVVKDFFRGEMAMPEDVIDQLKFGQDIPEGWKYRR